MPGFRGRDNGHKAVDKHIQHYNTDWTTSRELRYREDVNGDKQTARHGLWQVSQTPFGPSRRVQRDASPPLATVQAWARGLWPYARPQQCQVIILFGDAK